MAKVQREDIENDKNVEHFEHMASCAGGWAGAALEGGADAPAPPGHQMDVIPL